MEGAPKQEAKVVQVEKPLAGPAAAQVSEFKATTSKDALAIYIADLRKSLAEEFEKHKTSYILYDDAGKNSRGYEGIDTPLRREVAVLPSKEEAERLARILAANGRAAEDFVVEEVSYKQNRPDIQTADEYPWMTPRPFPKEPPEVTQ